MGVYTSPSGHTYLTDGSTLSASGAEVGADKGTGTVKTFKAGDPNPVGNMWDGLNQSVTGTGKPLTQQQADVLNKIQKLGGTITAYKGSGIGGGEQVVDLPPDAVYNLNYAELRSLSNVRSTSGESTLGGNGLALMSIAQGGSITGTGEVHDPVAGYYVSVPNVSKVQEAVSSGTWNKNTGSTSSPSGTSIASGTPSRLFAAGDPNPNTGVPMSQAQADNLNKQGVRYNPTTGAISSQTTNASNTSSSINGGNVSNTGNAGTVNNQSALDIINKSGLDEGTKALFREVINQWDPNNEVNIQNVMGTFENIKKNTISPYFQEQANIFIDEVKRAGDYLSGERQRELETEGISAKRNIENAQKNLESRGMTFSGESEKALGEKGAYGTGKTIPARFGGMEGEVNAQNRLMASSSSARYSKSLQDLSRQAEQNLGTVKAQGLVPGVNMLGGVTGSLTRQEKQAEGDALSNIYQQETINREARNPLEVIK